MRLGLGIGLSVGNPGNTVRSIPGLGLWYDASGLSAVTGLASLSDLSGNGHTATSRSTKPNVVANVQNGRSALRAAGGAGEGMTLTGPTFGSAFSIIWVGTASSTASSYMFCNTSNILALISHFTATALEWLGDGTERATIDAAPGSSWHIWQIDHTDGGSYVLWEDGVQKATGSSHVTASGSAIANLFSTNAGASNAACDLGEKAIWPARVISAAERSRAYNLLKLKWGTP